MTDEQKPYFTEVDLTAQVMEMAELHSHEYEIRAIFAQIVAAKEGSTSNEEESMLLNFIRLREKKGQPLSEADIDSEESKYKMRDYLGKFRTRRTVSRRVGALRRSLWTEAETSWKQRRK
jgi:hypothetical protein